MLIRIIFLTVGLFIGWNLPQPPWAVVVQDKALGMWNDADLPTSVDELENAVSNEEQ